MHEKARSLSTALCQFQVCKMRLDGPMKCHSKSENGEFRRQNANIEIKFYIFRKKKNLQRVKHNAGFFS